MSEVQTSTGSQVRVGSAAELLGRECTVVHAEGHTLALFAVDGKLYAVDNRCPHMGFPLDRGTVQDGILTCYWHYARFDLASGGTFDLFADDVPVYPVTVKDDAVWVDLTPKGDAYARFQARLRNGLEHDISLVIAKAIIAMLDSERGARDVFRLTLDFGAKNRRDGWDMGQTIHSVMMNLLPYLDNADRAHALYHGAVAVASAVDGSPASFQIDPLPRRDVPVETLKRWFQQFVEVRDGEGAERCVVSAVAAGASGPQLAAMLFTAETDHRYLSIGHVADFTNKALEALDSAGWADDLPSRVLASLVPVYVAGRRQEESNAWRRPVDLVVLLDAAFDELPQALAAGRTKRGLWQPLDQMDELVTTLLADDPGASVEALLTSLRDGATEEQLAAVVTGAAIRRMAHFHTSNEFGDWDTVLHTLSFANAMHQGIRRLGESVPWEVLRGVFDAAMSIYLDRFLNIPTAPIPTAKADAGHAVEPEALCAELLKLLDRQQEVEACAELVARYMASDADPARLIATLGHALIREDQDFHTIQTFEAAISQYERWRGALAATHALIAAARYLAAHAPTSRAMGQTFRIARRLHRGEKIFEG